MTTQIAQSVNINELVDIQSVVIDTSLPVADKVKSYHKQIKNQNCFLYDDTVVHVSFMESGPSLKDRIKLYLLSGQSAEMTSV